MCEPHSLDAHRTDSDSTLSSCSGSNTATSIAGVDDGRSSMNVRSTCSRLLMYASTPALSREDVCMAMGCHCAAASSLAHSLIGACVQDMNPPYTIPLMGSAIKRRKKTEKGEFSFEVISAAQKYDDAAIFDTTREIVMMMPSSDGTRSIYCSNLFQLETEAELLRWLVGGQQVCEQLVLGEIEGNKVNKVPFMHECDNLTRPHNTSTDCRAIVVYARRSPSLLVRQLARSNRACRPSTPTSRRASTRFERSPSSRATRCAPTAAPRTLNGPASTSASSSASIDRDSIDRSAHTSPRFGA